jgi:hypothetical protein
VRQLPGTPADTAAWIGVRHYASTTALADDGDLRRSET